MGESIVRATAIFTVLGGAPLLSGCGNCGPIPFCFDTAREHSKTEVMEYHRNMSSRAYEVIGYRGSDATHHYYIARPVDWFVFYQIPKAQLKLHDERPLQGSIEFHYKVSPKDDIWTAVDHRGKRLD